jgi:hypothetical protein
LASIFLREAYNSKGEILSVDKLKAAIQISLPLEILVLHKTAMQWRNQDPARPGASSAVASMGPWYTSLAYQIHMKDETRD